MSIEFLCWQRITERLKEVGVELEQFLGPLHHPWAGVHVAIKEGVAGADLPFAVNNGGADGVEDGQKVDDTENLAEG